MGKMIEEAIACAHEYWPSVDASPEEAARIEERRKKVVHGGIIEWRQKLYDALCETLPGYRISDYTDDDEESACVGYLVLLHEGQDRLDDDVGLMETLGGTMYELYIYCSVIAPFFYMQCQRTEHRRVPEGDWWNYTLVDAPDASLPERVRGVFCRYGFEEMTREMITHPVPGLRSDFADPEEANVFTYLFEALFTRTIGRDLGSYIRKPYVGREI